ncbi:EAL domain-containing protein [Spiroplasma turonicum]|nr:EAL domain-containing protein [Spiroplasma turonicum]
MADKTNLFLTIFVPVISFWLLVFFVSWYASIGVATWNILNLFVFSSLFSQYFGSINEGFSRTLIIIFYTVPFITSILKRYFLKKTSLWLLVSLNILTIFIALLSWNFIENNIESLNLKMLIVLITTFVSYIIYLLAQTVDQIYIHALKLQNIVVYENEHYLNFSSAHFQILDLIMQKKIRYAIYCNFYIASFEKFENKVSNVIRDYIFSSVASDCYNNITKNFDNAIFFKPNYKTFGVFIPLGNDVNLQIDKNKDLLKLFKLFQSIKNVFTIKNHKIKINIRSANSIYGIHSNDLDKLSDFNNYLIKNQATIVDDFNLIAKPNEILLDKNKIRKIASLNEVVNLNLHTTLYEPIYNIINWSFEGYYLNGMINGEEFDSSNFKPNEKLIDDMGLSSLFLRYISLNSLKDLSRKYSKEIIQKLIFVNYDSDYLSSSEFDKDEFLFKLKNLKLNLKNIVLNFKMDKEINNKVVLKNNIMFLKSNNFKISISNFGTELSDYGLIHCYEPDFIFLVEEVSQHINGNEFYKQIILEAIKISEKIESKIIATGVNSYIIYKRLKELGIKNFMGDLIGSSSELKLEVPEELNYLLKK